MALKKLRRPSYPHKRLSNYDIFRSQWDEQAPRVSMILVPFIDKPAPSSVDDDDSLQVEQRMRALATRLTSKHPEISTDPGIYGGNPHLKNFRLTVGNVLAKLYVYGSTKKVADIYAPDINEGQIKEAIAYAQDFLEAAIHSHKAPQSDGG